LCLFQFLETNLKKKIIEVLSDKESRKVVVPNPGRHFLGKFDPAKTEGNSRGAVKCQLKFQKDITLYTIFMTTEPAQI